VSTTRLAVGISVRLTAPRSAGREDDGMRRRQGQVRRSRRAQPAVPRFVQLYKGYAGCEHCTSRQIPLVLLTRPPLNLE
jgi:hypothetical protein